MAALGAHAGLAWRSLCVSLNLNLPLLFPASPPPSTLDERRMQVSRPTAPNACPLDSKGDASVQASAELLRNQKMMVEFLAGNTLNASDLQPNYSGIVTDAWAAFYESECGADDPTCGSAHEQLGRLLTDGFAANSTGEALVNLPADSPLGLLQAQLNETYRISDCERANATNFTSAACLCNGTIPYLHCNALAALESAASIETALRNNVITVDPGALRTKRIATDQASLHAPLTAACNASPLHPFHTYPLPLCPRSQHQAGAAGAVQGGVQRQVWRAAGHEQPAGGVRVRDGPRGGPFLLLHHGACDARQQRERGHLPDAHGECVAAAQR